MTKHIGRVKIAETIDGECCPNLFGVALIAGRTIPELAPYFNLAIARASSGPMDWHDIMAAFPADIGRDAKRRAREAQAHANTTDLVEILRYWAVQSSAEIHTDPGGNVWITRVAPIRRGNGEALK